MGIGSQGTSRVSKTTFSPQHQRSLSRPLAFDVRSVDGVADSGEMVRRESTPDVDANRPVYTDVERLPLPGELPSYQPT